MLRHFYNIILLSFIFGVNFIYSSKAYAQEKSSFSLIVEPAYQEIEILEGSDGAEATLTFRNSSDVAQQIELFAYDFKQTDHFGSIALLDGFTGEYLHTLVSFLSFEKSSFVVDPHSEEELVVKIKNGQTLSPGGHYAAVVARAMDEQISSYQKILPAVSALLLVRKTGGERVHLSLKEIGWNPKLMVWNIPDVLNLLFENEGNVHVVPRGTIKVKDLFNRVIFQGIINDSSLFLLPGTLREIPVNLNQSRSVFPLMLIFIEIDGRSDVGEAVFSSELSFLYMDRRLIFILLVAVAGQVLWFKRRRKKSEKN